MRLGVFGGTFDPVHNGHLIVADEAAESLELDQVLFVPAGVPWLKEGTEVTDPTHRLEMVRLGIAGNERFRPADLEVRRPGPSYTVDTLEELVAGSGDGLDIYLLVGLDALLEIDRWHNPQRVLELATIVGVPRPGCDELNSDALDRVWKGAAQEVVLVKTTMIGISGTEVRGRVSRGQSIRYLVPEPVAEYVYDHGLYGGARE